MSSPVVEKRFRVLSAALLGCAAVLVLALVWYGVTAKTRIQDDDRDTQVDLSADYLVVTGACVRVTWETEGIREIYFDGAPAVGWGDVERCYAGSLRPTFEVLRADGATVVYSLGISTLPIQLLLLGALTALALALLVRQNRLSPRVRVAALLGALTAAAFVLRDAVILDAFSFGLASDTGTYLHPDPLRTWAYPLMVSLTDGMSDPFAIIWLQILAAAGAAGALVYVVARRDRLLGGGIGLFLVFDLAWATMNRWMLSESPFTSFHVLSLALLLYQFEHCEKLRAWEFAAAGVLYGWTALIRPSGFFITLLILAVYWGFTRCWRKVVWVAAGIAALALVSGLVMLGQTGTFKLWSGTGVYMAFPLYVYDLFSPENGPVSQEMDAILSQCEFEPRCDQIMTIHSNECIFPKIGCLEAHGWDREYASSQITRAYIEAVLSQPVRYVREIFVQAAYFLIVPVGDMPEEGAHFLTFSHTDACEGLEFAGCGGVDTLLEVNGETRERLFAWYGTISDVTLYTAQVPLTLFALLPGVGFRNFDHPVLFMVVWVACIVFLLASTHGVARVMVLTCVGMILYTALTVVAGHVMLPRYTSVLSPFQIVLSVTLVATAGRRVVGVARKRAERGLHG